MNIDTDQLIYLSVLGVALVGMFLISNRVNLGKMAQYAAIWVLIFVGGVAAVGMWNDIRTDLKPQQVSFEGSNVVEVQRQANGHYFLTLAINDVPVNFIVDTGATDLVLTEADAQRVGLKVDDLNFIGRANTANGVVKTAPVRLDRVQLGPITDTGVYAVVNDGEMRQSLLGMGYLENWGRIEIERGTLRLTR